MPEYSRIFLNEHGPEYTQAHIELMAKGQVDLENRPLKSGPFPVILDTSLEVHAIWSEVKYGSVSPWIAEEWPKRPIDGFVLCRPDLPWAEDPLRENPFDRDMLFERYCSMLTAHKKRFAIVEGKGPDRLAAALEAVHSWA